MSEPSPERPWPAMSLAQATAILTTAPGSPFHLDTAEIDGRTVKVWASAPPSLRELFQVGRAHGERPFLIYEDERASFEAFARATLAFAAALRHAGVGKGDRVAIAMRNLPEWPVAFFATALVGGVAACLNAWWTGPELEYGLKDCGAKVAVFDVERFERLRDHLSTCCDLSRVFVSRAADEIEHPLVSAFESAVAPTNRWADLPPGEMPDVKLEPEDACALFYTSGTTGKPKGAIGTHRNASHSGFAGLFSIARAFVRRGEMPPQPDPSAPQRGGLVSIPFFHTTGCNAVMIPALMQGQKLAMQRRFDAEGAFALIERERLTSAGGVPTVAWQLLEHPARSKYDLSSLEGISYGGAPGPVELVRKLNRELPNAMAGSGWGMTETSATHTHHIGEDYAHRPDSAGPPAPVCEIKVVNEAGETLPNGEVGELMAYGPNVVKGYWRKREATAATFIDGWVRTGDLARIDDEGFLFIVDRAKDMIIRGGENIFCSEVEDVLYQHPGVRDVALVPMPHRELGEVPAAVVTRYPGSTVTEDELRAFAAERIAAFKVPVAVRFTDQLLPRNAAGKILKTELKGLFAPTGAPPPEAA